MRRLALAFSVAALVCGSALSAHAQTISITSSIAVNTTWGPTGTVVGTVFWVKNSINVNAGVTLNIQPGVVVKFNPSTQFVINGSLRCIGTGPGSIVFTSIKDDNVGGDTNGDGLTTVPNASDWYGINWPDASPDFGSRLHFCDVQFAGTGAGGALTFTSASDTISSCNIRRSYYGVDCAGTAAPVLTSTSIEAATQTPIVLDFTAAPVFSSLVFSSANNGYDAFGLRGATLTTGTFATLPQRGATVGINPVPNVTYVLFGALTINAGAGLTIAPGVVIKPTGAHVIQVFGNLTMNGTAGAGNEIVMTSIHDDNYGLPSDTNNNGSITAPAPGNVGYVNFNPGSTGSVQYTRIKFATTSATLGAISMTNNSIGISNCTLTDAGHGLAILGISNPAINTVAINNCTSTPILMSVSANPTFTSITFLANAITALGLNGEPIAVDSHIFFRNVAGYNNITYYLMNGPVQMLSPAILTIDAGVVIKNQQSGGGFIIDGGLIADGTPSQPIVFTSQFDDSYGNPPDTNGDGSITVPASANWSYIRFTGTADDPNCLMDNCRVTYASYGPFDGWNTAIWATSSAPTISNCFISKCSYGIRVDGNGTAVIDACDINNCGAAPIVMSVLADPAIHTNNVYSTNTYAAIALMSETLSQNARIRYRPGVGTPTYAYLPTGTITVASGVTLAIDPLVVLKPTSSFILFTVNGSLNVVGSNTTTGRVIITSRRDDNPIYGGDTTPLDSSTPQGGDWGNIVFNDTSVDGQCILRNCLFQFGGSGGNDGGCVLTSSASPRVVHIDFFQCLTAFTCTGNSSPTIDSTTILNCTQLPIVFSLISDPKFPHPDEVKILNSAYTCLGLLAENVAQDVRTGVRRISGIPNIAYCPTGTITIAFGSKWTIDPGIVMKFGRISGDPIGVLIYIDGALVADGKPDSLIVFTSSADDAFGGDVKSDGALTVPAAGHWYGIEFRNISNDAVTVIDNCRFRYGGGGGAGAFHFISAGPTITNTYVSYFTSYGTLIDGSSTPTFTNCQFDTCSNVPVQMSLVSEPVFNNVQFIGNTYTALGIVAESIAQDVLWKIRAVSNRNNMPYLLQGQLTVGLGATVVMQPGVIVKSNSGGSIFVQRAFRSEGSSAEPESLVVFTSYRDDFYGGDTNNDGLTTTPIQSDWNYITIDGTAIDAECRFKNTVLRYGGSGTTLGVIRCVNSSPSIDSCLISTNAVGISVEGASNPHVHECSLFGNANFAINNTGNSFCVDADSCWWGAASGPNDASATADLCGLGLNAGLGDKSSNNVDYTPFKTGGLVNMLIGDVSLNGQVLAYDASLVMQSLVAMIVLTPLQQQVADVTGDGTVAGLDASKILQYVAGVITAFPAVNNRGGRTGAEGLPGAPLAESAAGTFQVALGEPVRAGDGAWEVPVIAHGTAPLLGLELRLEGEGASALAGVTASGGERVLTAQRAADGVGRVALAAADALGEGEVARLRFDGDGNWKAPRLAWARANESQVAIPKPAPTLPSVSLLGRPWPNPAAAGVTIDLALAPRDAGEVRVRVLDAAGRRVRDLDTGNLPPGTHAVRWDLRDTMGRAVPAGLYYLQARAGGFSATRTVIVVH